jgi:hypothetical protein
VAKGHQPCKVAEGHRPFTGAWSKGAEWPLFLVSNIAEYWRTLTSAISKAGIGSACVCCVRYCHNRLLLMACTTAAHAMKGLLVAWVIVLHTMQLVPMAWTTCVHTMKGLCNAQCACYESKARKVKSYTLKCDFCPFVRASHKKKFSTSERPKKKFSKHTISHFSHWPRNCIFFSSPNF